MKYKYSKILLLIFFLITKYIIHSQETVFSQFQNNPIYLNPALAGQYKFRLSCVNNNQWFNIPGQFNTQYVSIDGRAEPKGNKFIIQKEPSLNDGFLVWGCSFLRNSEGELSLNTNNVSFIIGYRKEIKIYKKSLLSFTIPLQYSLISKSIDFSNAIFMQNLDPVFGNINSNNFVGPSQSYTYPTFTTGFNLSYLNHLVSSEADYKFDFGVAFSNFLLKEKEGFISQSTVDNSKFTFYITLFFINSIFYRNSIFYQKQNIFETLQITSDLKSSKYKNFTLGLSYRHQLVKSNLDKTPFESLHVLVSFFLNQNSNYPIRITPSYGFTLSDLEHKNTSGIAEISLQIVFDKNNQWEFCPGDKGYRTDLNKKKNNVVKKNNNRKKNR